MRRRLSAFLVTGSAAAIFVMFAADRPASAAWVCTGEGTAATNSPVFYPGLGPTPDNGFVFALEFGLCAHSGTGTTGKTVTATGVFLGWCGLSSGLGTLGQGDLFAWIGVGGILVLTGHIAGVVDALPDLVNGESCITGADRFVIAGAILLPNCPADLGTPGALLDTDTSTKTFFASTHFWTNGPCVPDPLTL